LNVPLGGDVEARARSELVGYYAHIEATDHAIGRLLGSIGEANTIVIFTSVHGDMHGSHGLFRKGWPYEESVRVPLLVRFPRGGAITQGENRAAVSLVDLPAMIRVLADGRQPSSEPGYAEISMPSVVALPHQCNRVWRGLRSPDRKLILNGNGEPWLFFDLKRDPYEMNNLINDASRKMEIARLGSQIQANG
jgi:arylsulfatase A-like enzyme